tara:strand:+ start:612 stop:947 length:336 start_codon:yes stop_codon:yes gene_type:complete
MIKINIPEKIMWSLQRLSAILILIFTIWFLISFFNNNFSNYEETILWIKKSYNSIILFVFSTSIFFHSSLGLTVIIDDYVHDNVLKKLLSIFKNLVITTCIVFSGISLYLI